MANSEKKTDKVNNSKKEIVIVEHFGYKFTLDHDKITVHNQTNQKCFYKFINEEKKFIGHVDYDVIPTKWVTTQPAFWPDHPNEKKIFVEIVQKDKLYRFDINFEKNTILDVTDRFIQITYLIPLIVC